MKRRDLERHLRAHGVRLLREGGNHSFWGFDAERSTHVWASRWRHVVVADADIPKSLPQTVGEIEAFTDQFCAERLDAEYADLCRRLIGTLASTSVRSISSSAAATCFSVTRSPVSSR